MRKTKAVAKVQDFFDQRQSAVSVVELVDHFSAEMNKVTVYRILTRLEEERIIHAIIGKDGLKWYARDHHLLHESCNGHHAHFQCSRCRRMTCIPVQLAIPEMENYQIERENILLIGKCEECQTILETS